MTRSSFTAASEKCSGWYLAAVARIMPVEQLRWLAFGHFEADECGLMNEWLAAAPAAELTHGMVGCRVSIGDMADRPPRVLSSGEVNDIGGKRLRAEMALRSRTATSWDPRSGRKTYSDTPALDRRQAQRFASIALGDHYDARLQATAA
jgi:hypothetical protein